MDHRRDSTHSEELLVLVASVSAEDRRWIERTVKNAGFEVRIVLGAEEARDEIDGHAGGCVLVIDAGFLQMPQDGWRNVCAVRRRVRTIVRCLIPEERGLRWQEDRTVFVHPDCGESLIQALRAFRAASTAD